MHALRRLFLVSLGGLLAIPTTYAASSGKTAAACNVVISSLIFPTYDSIAHSRSSAIGTVQIDCPPEVVSINPRLLVSSGRSGHFLERRMTSGEDSLRYNLYLEPSHVRVAGDGTGGSAAITSPSAQSRGHFIYTIYAIILPGQTVRPGQYSDDLTIQMEF